MSMQPYSPMDELMAINRFMSDALSLRPHHLGEWMNRFSKPLDLYETANGYEIHYPIAAAKPESIEVTVHNNMISISWETGTKVPANARQLHSSIQHGTYQEQFTLPAELDAQSAGANYENGILYIHVAKAKQGTSKTIRVMPEKSSASGSTTNAQKH
ncbi:MAG TPA: Hsp20/alpha crystallin family protein [Ktedonobacteraceae bacterium]